MREAEAGKREAEQKLAEAQKGQQASEELQAALENLQVQLSCKCLNRLHMICKEYDSCVWMTMCKGREKDWLARNEMRPKLRRVPSESQIITAEA